MESLYDLILRLKRETNSITINPSLDEIDLTKIKEFEVLSQENSFYKAKLKVIRDNLKHTDYIFSDRHNNAYDAYNELIIYEYLTAKIETEFVSEIKDIKTPDFRLIFNESEGTYADLKTLHFANGNNNYIDAQNQGSTVKIDHEKEIAKRKKAVVFSDPISISPFKRGNNEDHFKTKLVIETLIDKISSLLKIDQINYNGKHGIYIVDTSHIGLPCDLKLGLPVHDGILHGELVSGILWNVAFGKIGDPTYNYIEWEGLPNIGERLNKNGLLQDDAYNEVKAIAFILNSWSEKQKKVIGLFRSEDHTDQYFLKILYKISDFVNDDKNSYYWMLKEENLS